MDLLSCESDESWDSVMRDPVVSEFWSDAMSTDDSYTGSSSLCETPRSPSSFDGTDSVESPEAVEGVPQISELVTMPCMPVPVSKVSTGPTVEEFMMSAGCGLTSAYLLPLAAPKSEADLSSLVTKVVVRRREMNASNPLFHSIRTRTASVVSVCFFGSEAQVCAISQRVPRIFFGVESFQTAAEGLKSNSTDVLLLVKMRNVNECAHFAFSHGALTIPPPTIYAAPESLSVASLAGSNAVAATSLGAPSQPLFACVFEFVLAAIDTTIRNLGGQRSVNVDLDVLLNNTQSGLQDAFADFQVQVDVQLGLAGRSARPRGRGDSRSRARQARVSKASTAVAVASGTNTHAPVQTVAKSATRVYKRGSVEQEYNLDRKVAVARTLDEADSFSMAAYATPYPFVASNPSVYANHMASLPVSASGAASTTTQHFEMGSEVDSNNMFYSIPVHPSHLYSQHSPAPQQYQHMQLPNEHVASTQMSSYSHVSYAPQTQSAAQLAYGSSMYGQYVNSQVPMAMNEEAIQSWFAYPAGPTSSFAYPGNANSFTPSSYTPAAISTSSGPYRDGGFF